ncbi:helix-turn-helix transcriptional regulator [Arthrobacter sp. NPDC097144]|uniref:helix-turn-helix transcriptional regulator n=1 Tax=Arthrobacter sp. NPDC097144 TaxID=3363946 RepID=UPI003830611D
MRASRLLALLLVLQTRQRMTTGELAHRLEVSRRTVLRDVEALSAAGVPVYAERGRNGGIVLLPGSRLNASHLEPAEMEALSIPGLDRVQREQLGMAAAHEMATAKIAARRASAATSKPGLANLVIVENASWLTAAGESTDVAALALDLRGRNRLRVRYRRSGTQRATAMIVDPYGLASKAGRWYLVADHEQEPGLFNLDRLEGYEVLPHAAETRAGQDLHGVWAVLKQRTENLGSVIIYTRLREDRCDLVTRILGSRLVNIGPSSQGWCSADISYPDIESVRQLLQFANHIEIVSPPDARRRFFELASDIALRHRPEHD